MKQSGLYLIGMETKKHCWVKVGISENINQRMKKYNTHNPEYNLIDTWLIDNELLYKTLENQIHKTCFKSKNKSEKNNEWFIVSQKRYDKILKRGFKGLKHFKEIYDGD